MLRVMPATFRFIFEPKVEKIFMDVFATNLNFGIKNNGRMK